MKIFIRTLIIVIIVGAIGGTLYFLWSKSQEKPVLFTTANAFVSDVVKKTTATGSVVPRKEIDIVPQVSGIIEEVYVEAGQMVNEGDLIARIKIIPNMLNLSNAESRLNRARINQEDAKRDYERQLKLFEGEVISRSEFEDYEVAYKTAKEELKAAQDNLDLVKKGQTQDSGAQTNTIVRSTISGMVLDVPVEVGNSVIETNTFNPGTTVASIADMGEMVFEGKIDESEVGKIKEGMPLILTIGALEDVTFDAILEHISPKGVEENGAIQFEIKADVNLKEGFFIRAGYSANADIVLNRVDSVLVVSESLLQFEGDTAYVEVETEPQMFERREIETGLSDGINIEITEGLSEEDKIKVPERGQRS